MNSERPPLLSICIPTYNRSHLVTELVSDLLRNEGDFEICVHNDGSVDDTQAALSAIADQRLKLSTGSNRGRASALRAACAIASGRYIMLFDDDDRLFSEGLRAILTDCADEESRHAVGMIYHMIGADGVRIGDDFPISETNFLALRADYGVRGDKKEVVLAQPLLEVFYDYRTAVRRVPTSLLWSRLALHHNVICRNIDIGCKNYLVGGMTSDILRLKRGSPLPLADLYATHLLGFVRGRTRSVRHALRALFAYLYHRIRHISVSL